ncbi:MAG: endonuclease/exonuclease/phosphatase family protein, partial [Burkholderiales bacterium]|nr:endonuclease/exonuclease/phosphatase family protein [Burkholderiales bacterium]
TLTDLLLSYTGEQWRLGSLGRVDRLDFQVSLDATSLTTGTWVNVDALDFTAPITAGTVGALNGNAAANRTSLSNAFSGLSIANGATFWIRWADFNATGSDDGLGIDDFSLTVPSPPPPAGPSVSLSVSSNVGSETELSKITVTATASAVLATEQSVSVAVSGTGITAGDYTLSSTLIVIPAGQSSASVTFSVLDDTLIEGSETATLTLVSPSSGLVLGSTISQAIVIADNDFAPPKTIAEIQGAGHISPLLASATATAAVSGVHGIVTALASNGFYMQDPTPDGNPATSDGIFVFTSTAPGRTVGEAVIVAGTVSEFRPGGAADSLTVTELGNNPAVQALVVTPWTDAPSTLITPIVLGVDRIAPTEVINDDFAPGAGGNVETGGDFDPVHEGIDFYESLEGMLGRVVDPVAVSPTLVSGNAEEIWVLPNNGAGATGRTEHGGSRISAADFNPERLQLDDLFNAATTLPSVDVGARLSTVDGVISYSGTNYELLLPSAPSVVAPSTLVREVTALTAADTQLTVATFNVENLDPGDGAAKFNALAAAVVTNLRSPDILSLEEIQDNNGATNNGVVDANITFETLIAAIVAAGGPHYEYRQINPVNNADGGEPGGNIRVGFLFNPARVGFVEGSLHRLTDTDLSDGDAFLNSRKPLVGTFTFNGEDVTVVGNHFISKGGDDALFGSFQPPVLSSEAQRVQQATVVKNFVAGQLSSDPAAKIVVLGDLNDFEFAAPLTTLKTSGLADLVETLLPADQRFTYNFQGNAQAIDHILVSAALLSDGAKVDVVHINSEFQTQVSDHDPLVARLHIERDGLIIKGTSGRDVLTGTNGADTITGAGGRDVLTGGAGGDKFVYTSVLDAGDQITDFEPGADLIVVGKLLASVGYLGSDPLADGTLRLLNNGHGGTTVMFDPDGFAGAAAARALVDLVGVPIDLLPPELPIFSF